MERILFDILNLGLKDLENNSIEEILKSKQEMRINNFIISMTDDKNNNGMFNSNFETDFSERVKDKKNYLRYVIYFHCLKEKLPHIEEEIRKLKSYCYTEDEISKNNELIEQTNSKLETLTKEITQFNKNIEARKKELDNPNCLLRKNYESEQKSDKQNRKQKQDAKVQVEQKLQRLKWVNFISEKYGNELEPALEILNDIQKNWGVALENFIFRHMLKYPSTISQLRKDYSFSMWGFVEFLLIHKDNQNFNRALYEIDKTKKREDFQGDENKKQTEKLRNDRDSINSLNENQRKLVNGLFRDDSLENSWMRKAFWILFAGIILFVGIVTAPLLAIIISDIFMALGALLLTLVGVGLIILLIAAACESNGSGLSGLEGTGIEKFIFGSLCAFKNMPWLTFKDIPIIPYYCSTFFSVAIPIATVILIAAIAFYVYKRMQFNSMIKVPLHMQQEKSKLEQEIETYKNKFQYETVSGIKSNEINNYEPSPTNF